MKSFNFLIQSGLHPPASLFMTSKERCNLCIIYAWIIHRWIVNRWIVYRELAQPSTARVLQGYIKSIYFWRSCRPIAYRLLKTNLFCRAPLEIIVFMYSDNFTGFGSALSTILLHYAVSLYLWLLSLKSACREFMFSIFPQLSNLLKLNPNCWDSV